MSKMPGMSRRNFMLSAAAAAARGSLARAAAVGRGHSGMQALAWPPMTEQNRPWTRYWWMGSAVDPKNLAAELHRYHAAGLGGLEVTPIYGAKGWEDHYIPYLSRRWMEMLDFDIQGAHQFRMGVDMTTGTGWNMGGPDITGAYASLYARPIAIKAPNAQHEPWRVPSLRDNVIYARAFSDTDKQVEVPRHHFQRGGSITWPRPAGQWTLVVLVGHPGSHVKRAAPGGHGMMLNTIYPPAMTHYLRKFTRAFAATDAAHPRAMFHDSYEYNSGVPGGYGEWSADFFDRFAQRRGYRLEEHLLALAGVGRHDTIGRVKSDYRQTVSELISDEVFPIWVQWAHKHGMLARNQAHGSPTNLLDFYAMADIPETEDSVLDRNGWYCDPLFAKFASSAAHVAGRALASSETFTWLGEHFTITLATMKRVVDRCLVGGINHIFYQGTCYSPEEANPRWPGWLWYASVDYNGRMGIWRDSVALNEYIARCQSLLQAGKPDNDVLLYWPIFDQWHDPHGLGQYQTTGAVPQWFYRRSIGRTARQLWKHGYGFDYISDAQLLRTSADQHGIHTPGGVYKAVVVPKTEYMPAATLEQLMNLARHGATIIFDGPIPTQPPGMHRLATERKKMAALAARVPSAQSKANGISEVAMGAGRIFRGSPAAALHRAGVERETLVDHHGMTFIRRRDGESRTYFLAWDGDRPFRGNLTLAAPATGVVIMNALTGETGMAKVQRDAAGRPTLHIQIEPHGSLLLRTMPNLPPVGASPYRFIEAGRAMAHLKGPWRVEFIDGGPTLPKAYNCHALRSWTDNGDEQAQYFTGTARYTIRFDRPPGTGPWVLNLGEVHESARVRLNGVGISTLIQAPFQVVLTDLAPVGNMLEVEVTNLSANRIRYMDRQHIPWRVFNDINFVSITYHPFNAAQWPVHPSGLLGPVTIHAGRQSL